MAFLVCFKKSDCEFSWRDKAIYLDQKFYEMIFNQGYDADCILKRISRLNYDGELEVEYDQLAKLKAELLKLGENNNHGQISEFIDIVNKSLESSYSLMIAGDMPYTLS